MEGSCQKHWLLRQYSYSLGWHLGLFTDCHLSLAAGLYRLPPLRLLLLLLLAFLPRQREHTVAYHWLIKFSRPFTQCVSVYTLAKKGGVAKSCRAGANKLTMVGSSNRHLTGT